MSSNSALDEFLNSIVSAPKERRRVSRKGYTYAQKADLIAESKKIPQRTQRELQTWFFDKYGLEIPRGTLGCLLGRDRRGQSFEEDAVGSLPKYRDGSAKRHRQSELYELEEQLYTAQQRLLQEQGTKLTGDMIKDAARTLFNSMEAYQGKPMPSFSNGWLAGYRTRYCLQERSNRKRTAEEVLEDSPVRSAPPERSQTSDEINVQNSHPAPLRPIARHPPLLYHPRPAYTAVEGSPLHASRQLYMRIADTGHSKQRELFQSLVVPARSGRAFSVRAGQIVRITTPRGPQVGDLNIWNLHNPKERFWASRTRQLHASHVSVFDRLWSCLPYLRPMVTITGDSLAGYGVDSRGGRCHDLLGTRCDPYVRNVLTSSEGKAGDDYDFHCHSNLTRAIIPWGLSEADVHDVLNVFQVTGLDDEGRYFMAPCPAMGAHGEKASLDPVRLQAAQLQQDKPKTEMDYFEFFAEIDILCALSACPGGDLTCWNWDDEASMRATCRPLGVDVYDILPGAKARVLQGWTPPTSPKYRGMHGITIPTGESTP